MSGERRSQRCRDCGLDPEVIRDQFGDGEFVRLAGRCCERCRELLAEMAEESLHAAESQQETARRWSGGYESLLERCRTLRDALPESRVLQFRRAMQRVFGEYAVVRLDRNGLSRMDALQQMGPALKVFLGERQALRLQLELIAARDAEFDLTLVPAPPAA